MFSTPRGSSFLIGLGILLSLGSCENKLEEIDAIIKKEAPFETAEDIEMISSDSARVEFVLKAPLLERYKATKDSSYVEFPKGVEVTFYDKLGAQQTVISADYAMNYESQDRFFVKKNVKIINKNGDVLTGEHLWWDKDKKKIYSKDFVKIVTKDEVIYGNGLEANEDFTWYKILDIKGILSVKDQDL